MSDYAIIKTIVNQPLILAGHFFFQLLYTAESTPLESNVAGIQCVTQY